MRQTGGDMRQTGGGYYGCGPWTFPDNTSLGVALNEKTYSVLCRVIGVIYCVSQFHGTRDFFRREPQGLLKMNTLSSVIDEIRKRIALYQGKEMNEQNTKTALIDPVLRELGWEVGNLDEVMQEYKRKPQDNPVDYGLFLLRTPKIFIEAKALGKTLDDRKWANQIMGYAAVAGVKWAVITNGDEYRIYNACADVPVEEKLFRSVRLTAPDSAVLKTLELLSKDRIRDDEIGILWKSHFVDRQVKTVLESLFLSEPDPSLMRLVTKRVRDLSRKDVRASLVRVRAQFNFPVDPDSRPTGQAKTRELRRTGGIEIKKKRGTHKMLGVTLLDLIDAGLLSPSATLIARYKDRPMEATVLPDGAVSFQGKRYESSSSAGGAAIRAATGRLTASADGWRFWRLRDEMGNLVPLTTIRQEYLRRKMK
jgi:predicted type IV restriction endonuclease